MEKSIDANRGLCHSCHTHGNRITKMRTKTLLLTAAIAMAGIASSLAQGNVYSQNIVGYVNVVLVGGTNFSLVANPLDDGTNPCASLLASLPNKSQVQVWNPALNGGAGDFDFSQKTAGAWSPNLSIPPGTGFFVKPQSAAAITNTFVGQVIIPPGGTNTVALPALSFRLVGSPVPYAGNLQDPANTQGFNLGSSLPNK